MLLINNSNDNNKSNHNNTTNNEHEPTQGSCSTGCGDICICVYTYIYIYIYIYISFFATSVAPQGSAGTGQNKWKVGAMQRHRGTCVGSGTAAA